MHRDISDRIDRVRNYIMDSVQALREQISNDYGGARKEVRNNKRELLEVFN
jgi:hypothetical protein